MTSRTIHDRCIGRNTVWFQTQLELYWNQEASATSSWANNIIVTWNQRTWCMTFGNHRQSDIFMPAEAVIKWLPLYFTFPNLFHLMSRTSFGFTILAIVFLLSISMLLMTLSDLLYTLFICVSRCPEWSNLRLPLIFCPHCILISGSLLSLFTMMWAMFPVKH